MQYVVIVDEPRIADVVECMIEYYLPGEYRILKVASGAELLDQIGLISPGCVHSIFLGLSDANNKEVIDRLKQWDMRNNYKIVLLGEHGSIQRQHESLHADASLEKWSRFQQEELCRVIRRFEKVVQ